MLEKLHRIVRAHSADDDVVHGRVQRGRLVQQLGVQFLADQIHCRVAKNLFVRQDAEQVQAFALEAAPRKVGDVIHFVAKHLVEDDADDFDAFLFKQCLIQANFVNRFADAALRDDDDFCAKDFCDLRVGQIEHRADTGVAAAFAQHKILFPGDAVEGLLDFADERVVVGRLKIFAREIRLDGNRAHVHERTIHPVNRVHQHRVLVNFLLLDFDEALADGFDIADARKIFLQRGNQAERRGGFAVILARGGDENSWCGNIHWSKR